MPKQAATKPEPSSSSSLKAQSLDVTVMAVINITPDSFSDGDLWYQDFSGIQQNTLLSHVAQLVEAGATLLDIGGESTRPGAIEISTQEELRRVIPTIQLLRQQFPTVRLSIDTRKAAVAQAAFSAGAMIINDVSGFRFDPHMYPLVVRMLTANPNHSVILMHSAGTPETMQALVKEGQLYPNGVLAHVLAFFTEWVSSLTKQGVLAHQIVLDPGFGFAKSVTENLTLLKGLSTIKTYFPDCPLLVGTSRKSFLTMGNPSQIDTGQREHLTAATTFEAIAHGKANWLRIHDVQAQLPVMQLAQAFGEIQAQPK